MYNNHHLIKHIPRFSKTIPTSNVFYIYTIPIYEKQNNFQNDILLYIADTIIEW